MTDFQLHDVQSIEAPIMSIDEFKNGLLQKDNIPGLLVRSDENGYYNIGIQINDQEVLKVASAGEDDAMAKIEFWAERIDQIKDRYKDREPQLKHFGGNQKLRGK